MKTAAVIAIAAVVLAAASTAAPALSASLRIAATNPLVVQGRHFRAGERVRVTFVAPALELRVQRSVTAAPSGSFKVRFGHPRPGPCVGFTVTAVGTGGSRAVVKRPPLPACMPTTSP